MADISLQFHSLPIETAHFIEQVAHELNVNMVAIWFHPFQVKAINEFDAALITNEKHGCPRLAFIINEPNLLVVNELDFSDKNPDHLRLDIGRMSDRGLKQSWFSARTENPKALDAWRKVIASLKKQTQLGVFATNPQTGKSCAMKSFRYTVGAKELELNGIPMLPIAGTSVLRFKNEKK